MNLLRNNVCFSCDRQYETPIIANDHNTYVRLNCSRSLISQCLVCSDMQNINKVNKTNGYFSNEYKAEIACNELEKNLNFMEHLSQNPTDFINDYFSDLINKIDLRREQLKIEIDNKYEEILDHINNYKTECENFKVTETNQQTRFIERNLKKLRLMLENSDLNQLNQSYISNQAIKANLELEQEIKKLKNKILQSKKIEFDSSSSSYDMVSNIFKVEFFDNKQY